MTEAIRAGHGGYGLFHAKPGGWCVGTGTFCALRETYRRVDAEQGHGRLERTMLERTMVVMERAGGRGAG